MASGVLDAGRERLLAQHVLAGRQQRFGDLTVQVVGDHDADGVDVVGLDDRLPAGLGPFEAVAISGVNRANSSLTSAIATSRTGGASVPKTVWAVR